jgi:hypothetical protein
MTSYSLKVNGGHFLINYFYAGIAISVVYFFTLLIFSVKFKIKIKVFALNSFLGITALAFLKAIATVISFDIYINIVSVTLSLLFGPLGVAFFILLNYIFL